MVTADGLLIAAIDTRRPNSSSVFSSTVAMSVSASRPTASMRPMPAGALLQAAAVVDHPHGLLEGQQTGQMVGGHFAGAVADHRVGA